MKTTGPAREKPVKHPRALRVSWIVLIASLSLGAISILIPRTPGINWRQWTWVTQSSERTLAFHTLGIWYMRFDDSSGEHQIFAARATRKVWDEQNVRTETLNDFRLLKFNLFRARYVGPDWNGSVLSIGVPYYAIVIPSAILPIRYRRRRIRRWIAWRKLQ